MKSRLLLVLILTACSKSPDRPVDTAIPSPVPAAASIDPAKTGDDRLIDRAGIGPVKLGMTLAEVRKAIPLAKIERTSDGEGVALVEITLAPGSTVTAYAGEDNAEAAIDWTKKISMLETFSGSFHTAEGVHPGSRVTEVEKVYGMTKSVDTSEIESREYITFDNHPSEFTFRLGPDGKILSVSISSR